MRYEFIEIKNYIPFKYNLKEKIIDKFEKYGFEKHRIIYNSDTFNWRWCNKPTKNNVKISPNRFKSRTCTF